MIELARHYGRYEYRKVAALVKSGLRTILTVAMLHISGVETATEEPDRNKIFIDFRRPLKCRRL